MFNTHTYTAKLKELIENPNSNVLIIYGDCDEFTSIGRYNTWKEELGARDAGNLKMVKVAGANHFWRGQTGREMMLVVREWLP
jgi:uncharacterized protein